MPNLATIELNPNMAYTILQHLDLIETSYEYSRIHVDDEAVQKIRKTIISAFPELDEESEELL